MVPRFLRGDLRADVVSQHARHGPREAELERITVPKASDFDRRHIAWDCDRGADEHAAGRKSAILHECPVARSRDSVSVRIEQAEEHVVTVLRRMPGHLYKCGRSPVQGR